MAARPHRRVSPCGWRAGLLALAVAAAATGCGRGAERVALSAVPGGDAKAGRAAIQVYGCGSCHTIPGIPGANATVGPPLNDFAYRHYIAGRLPNTAGNLVRWIMLPQEIEPGTIMPNLGVTERDALDIAAYLATLD